MELERRRISEASVSDINDLAVLSPPVEPTSVKKSIAHAPERDQEDSEASAFMNDTGNTQDLILNGKDVLEKLEKQAKDLEESYRRFQSRMKNTGQDQFTSVPPVSLERHTLQGFPGRHAEIIEAQPSLGIDTNIDKADDFVPLSWVPATEKSEMNLPTSYVPSGHVGGTVHPSQFSSLLPSTRQDNTDSLTRFYSLPSFGVSEVTQSSSAPRYFGLSRTDRKPPNNTVNVSDLIAKPGSPSVISAPIDHSPMDNNTTDSSKVKKVRDRHGDSSGDTTRRPLSSTIDRVKEGTGMESRENDFLTSVSSQRNSDQNSHVPVIDGSVFFSRKSDIDKDLSEQESHRSSDASLSGGYLSLGTLNKPSRNQGDTKETAKTMADSTKNKESDKNSDDIDAYKSQPPTRISLDNAWGAAQGDSTGLRDKDEDSSISVHSIPSLSAEEKISVSLDTAWKDANGKRVLEEREKEKRERELREREEREWEEEKRKREEQRRLREEAAWEREQRELAELQREQDLRERDSHAPPERTTGSDEKEQQVKEEKESSKDPQIDPVMLQYMQMIQKKKEEEDKAKAAGSAKKENKEAAEISNSLLSQSDDNLGSIEELTEDDGFDWG